MIRWRLRLPLFFLALLNAGPAGAGDEETAPTRAERWRRLRLEKAKRLQPERPGFVERTLIAIEKAERPSVLDFNVGGVYPRIQSIASGSQTAAGARLWRPDIKGSPWDIHGSAFYSRRGYEFYDLQVGRIPHKAGRFPLRSTKGDDVYELGDVRRGVSRLILYASGRYRHYPQEDFFGLGNDSRLEDHTSFLLQDATYDLVAGWQLGPRAVVNVRAGLVQVSLGPGEDRKRPTTQARFTDRDAPGLLQQPDFLHLDSSLLLDYRDEPGNPHRGAMLGLSLVRFDDRGRREFAFTRLAMDARGFVPLGSPQRVVALRALAFRDGPDSGQRVPFYMQEFLGGSHTLRGFPNFRFRGEKLLALQAEYRWEAAPALELALFADAGKVARKGEALGLGDLNADYGFGLRVKRFNRVLVRFDVAWSHEDTRALLRFSPSF